MKKLFFLLFLQLFFIGLNAQIVDIPKDIKLETADDYKNSEDLVLKSMDWLLKNPLGDDTKKRQELSAFLIAWMSGSPKITIDLVEGIIPTGYPECLLSFMNGWVKHSLENDYSSDKVNCAISGIERAITFYDKNRKVLKKNKEIEKLKKIKSKGNLQKFVESKF